MFKFPVTIATVVCLFGVGNIITVAMIFYRKNIENQKLNDKN